MTADALTSPTPDRRQRRRQETIEEVLDIAVEIMATDGVAGLSLGEVARRMGIRPPSLYVYFPSKMALYDALFARGAREVHDEMAAAYGRLVDVATSLEEYLLTTSATYIRWRVSHPVYSQLLYWRPVPGFVPSEEAYAPAVELVEQAIGVFRALQERGWIRADVPAEDVFRDWTVITSGVASQQMSNAPDESFEDGRFTAALPGLVAMFARHYGTSSTPATARRHGNVAKRTARKR
jgi:AcrR family transcriptional regulator